MIILRKVLAAITAGILIVSLMLALAGCGSPSLVGRWESEKYGQVEYWVEFRSDGTFSYGSGPQGDGDSGNDTYTIDSDDSLHFLKRDFKKTTVEEMRKMSSSDASGYYAFDSSSAYFGDNEKEFKRK